MVLVIRLRFSDRPIRTSDRRSTVSFIHENPGGLKKDQGITAHVCLTKVDVALRGERGAGRFRFIVSAGGFFWQVWRVLGVGGWQVQTSGRRLFFRVTGQAPERAISGPSEICLLELVAFVFICSLTYGGTVRQFSPACGAEARHEHLKL